MKESKEGMQEELLGLTDQQVKERMNKGLVNDTNDQATKTVSEIFKSNIFTFFNFINLMLALCIVSVQSFRDMLFMGVVISNTCIGIVQELRAKKTVDKLSLIVQTKAKVIRNGKQTEIALHEVVLDDVMCLESGNQVFADSTVLEGECEVDESMLTGESDPVVKKEGDTLLSGSFLICGNIKAKVIRVGKDAYANKIVSQAKKLKKNNSQMMKSINFIIKFISAIIVPLGIIMFYKQFHIMNQTNQTIQLAVTGTVGAVIGMIPEGLVLLTSMVLAVSVIRLGREKTLVQDLYCIETLARVDVLCLDKTGTITEGTMEVEEVIPLSNRDYQEPLYAFTSALQDNNPTFFALKEKFQKESNWRCIKTVPFSSLKKWSLASFEGKGTYILGAAEFILGEKIKKYQKQVEQYARMGKRVLLFAHSKVHTTGKELPEDIEPLAFILITDKIRADAKETFEYFKNQEVTLKVISGDNPLTVMNIAKRAGLEGAEKYVDASTLKKEEIKSASEQYTVFGRVTPEQKLELVKALQDRGHTVAMTGDGVNDVLALKEADCSIAMESGSDVTRKTAQIVLMESQFSAMPKIVAEGRRAINNIERSAALFLVKTIYASLLAIIFLFLHVPYIFRPIQLTLISAIAIGVPSFLLALEPNYNLVKGKFIQNVIGKAMPGGLLVVGNVIAVVMIASIKGYSADETTTLGVFAVVFASLYFLFHICTPFNIKRAVMFIGLIASFFVAANYFDDLFMVKDFNRSMIVSIIYLGICSILGYWIFKFIVDKVMKKYSDYSEKKAKKYRGE